MEKSSDRYGTLENPIQTIDKLCEILPVHVWLIIQIADNHAVDIDRSNKVG